MSFSNDSRAILREVPVEHSEPLKLLEIQKEIPVVNKVSSTLSIDKTISTLLKSYNGGKKNRVVVPPKIDKKAFTSKKLESAMKEFNANKKLNNSVIESSSISQMLALYNLREGKELDAICHLIESHAICLREHILYRYLKTKMRNNILNEALTYGLDPSHIENSIQNSWNPTTILPRLAELPPEWYMVQITAQHENITDIRKRDAIPSKYSLRPMHSIHVTVIPTGPNAMEPICITLPKPDSKSSYDIRKQVEMILNNNKSDLITTFSSNDLYWKMRRRQNESMLRAISELEFSWLREWRVLLLGDYVENRSLAMQLEQMIDKLINDDTDGKTVSKRCRWLLKKVATGAPFLKHVEIERAVVQLLPKKKKLSKNIIISIIAKVKEMDSLKTSKRKTLVIVLDECMDYLPVEAMEILKDQPVTRFPSVHIAYALYKEHQATLVDGCKVVNISKNLGSFIVNPSNDLQKMENRMRVFINYWLPEWTGSYGTAPTEGFFKNALVNYDILMYTGHGSGIQFLRGEDIEKLRVRATVLLFGCSSLQLLPVGGRHPAYGISNQYLTACSPCILGMLWEVTDGDIDRMTAKFISRWIPSNAEKSWSNIDERQWDKGILEFKNRKSGKNEKEPVNSEMLMAAAKSKDVCEQYMTAAAIVIRGLPIKLVW